MWKQVGVALAALGVNLVAAQQPLPIKVVVVAMFEIGADSGDTPAEFQYWVERYPLDEVVPFPHGYRDLRLNRADSVLGIVTGIGTARAAASIMALGMDPRFDLSQAYWVVAGIAGADPFDMSVGSAAWAEWVIDGDLSHSIDIREAPADWPTGRIPLRRYEPYSQPPPENDEGVVYRLNPGLVAWAYALTKDIALADSEGLRNRRGLFTGYPLAQEPPKVILGDTLSAMNFWHGKLENEWANEWVKYWTKGRGNFVTTAMEDTGTMQSITFLTKAGRADRDRVLVLRTASNFSMQWPGVTAVESLRDEHKGGEGSYSGFLPSLEAAYVVGSAVVRKLVADWETVRLTPPTAGL